MQSVPTNQIDSDFSEFLNSLDNQENRSDDKKITLVKYGKGNLVKGTIEYNSWRERNHLATNKCRVKKQNVEDERKEKLEKIRNENNVLIEKQIKLFEEFDKLEFIFSQMATGADLPINMKILNRMHHEIMMMKDEADVQII